MNILEHCRVNVFPSNEAISCALCNELLELYLEAELANINVKNAYSKIWRHLQTCESCAVYHDWLYVRLRKSSSAGALSPASSKDLSFLPFHQPQTAHVATEPGWHMYLRPRLLGEPFLLRFSFSPTYLQAQSALLTAELAPATLVAQQPLSPHTLLKQQIPLIERNVVIEILAYPLAAALGLVRLQAIVVTPTWLFTKLQATLQWREIERVVKLTEGGTAELGLVSLAPEPLLNPAEHIFAVTFEGIA